MLNNSQALLLSLLLGDNQAMLKRSKSVTSARMAAKFREAFPPRGAVEDKVIAKRTGRTKGAVSNWRRTGTFDKAHIPIFVELSGRSYRWWMEDDDAQTGQVITLRPGTNRKKLDATRQHTIDAILGIKYKSVVNNFLHDLDDVLTRWAPSVEDLARGATRPGAEIPRSASGRRGKRGS